MKKSAIQKLKKYGVFLAAFFLLLLAAEDIIAQVISNQAARQDVRGTSRRTARRVDRRQDVVDAPNQVYVAPAPAAAAAVATAAILYSLPAGCLDRSGLFDCNGIFYRPQYQGTQVIYVQVEN